MDLERQPKVDDDEKKAHSFGKQAVRKRQIKQPSCRVDCLALFKMKEKKKKVAQLMLTC